MSETNGNGSWINRYTITSAGGVVIAILALYFWNLSLTRADDKVGNQVQNLTEAVSEHKASTEEIMASIKGVLEQNAKIVEQNTKAFEANNKLLDKIFFGNSLPR